MLTATHSAETAEKCFLQILDALEELSVAGAMTEREEGGDEADREIFDRMVEESVERGLDEESAERVFRAALAFWRKARQESV